MNREGTWKQGETYPVGGAEQIVSVDLDLDGRVDLVTLSIQNGEVAVLTGRGDGTFTTGLTYQTVGGPGIVAGVLGGDRFPSIVLAEGPTILRGIGDGSFLQPVRVGQTSWGAVALSDFNGDGLPDIAVGADDDEVDIFIGTADGGFASGGSYLNPNPGTPDTVVLDIVAGDLDGDGIQDLAVATSRDLIDATGASVGAIGVLIGAGDGTFKPWATYQAPGDSLGLTFGDRGPGGSVSADLVSCPMEVPGEASCGIYQLVLGDGGSISPLIGPADAMWSPSLGDFNNDHALDLAILGYSADAGSVARIYVNGCP